jgi:hypothetical protein
VCSESEEDYWPFEFCRNNKLCEVCMSDTENIFQVSGRQRKMYGHFKQNSAKVHNIENSMQTLNKMFGVRVIS